MEPRITYKQFRGRVSLLHGHFLDPDAAPISIVSGAQQIVVVRLLPQLLVEDMGFAIKKCYPITYFRIDWAGKPDYPCWIFSRNFHRSKPLCCWYPTVNFHNRQFHLDARPTRIWQRSFASV